MKTQVDMTARVIASFVCLGWMAGITHAAPHAPLPPPCVTGTLASYMALGAGGCSVDILLYNNFNFSVLSSSGGPTPLTAADIEVVPSFST